MTNPALAIANLAIEIRPEREPLKAVIEKIVRIVEMITKSEV